MYRNRNWFLWCVVIRNVWICHSHDNLEKTRNLSCSAWCLWTFPLQIGTRSCSHRSIGIFSRTISKCRCAPLSMFLRPASRSSWLLHRWIMKISFLQVSVLSRSKSSCLTLDRFGDVTMKAKDMMVPFVSRGCY